MKQQLIEAILDLRPEDQSVEELLPTLEGKTDEELLKDLLTSAKWYKHKATKVDVHITWHGVATNIPTGKSTYRVASAIDAFKLQHTKGVINILPDVVRWGYEPEKPQSNEE